MSVPFPSRLFIGGAWVETSETTPVIDPFTGEEFARAPLGGSAEIDRALKAAHEAFSKVRHESAHVRAARLLAIANGIKKREKEFVETIIREAGKPLTAAQAEVTRAQMTFTAAAEEARRQHGELLDIDAYSSGDAHFGLTRRFPLGVIAAVTPFNFPLNLVAHKVAPCLATGNTMVVKPAPRTPLTALLLAEVIAEAEVPAGQMNFITCANDQVMSLVTDARVKKVTFTGSSAVGWELQKHCSKKRLTLELGGNAGVILHEDADLATAIPAVASGGFGFAGQSCISVQRVLLHESIYERAKAQLVAHIREKIRTGDPHDPATVVGPMISPEATAGIRKKIDAALAAGAKLVCGGEMRGRCLEATVLEDVASGLDLCTQEAFAPIVTLHRYSHFEDALAQLNDSDFGLQAGVFTNRTDLAFRAFETLDVGGVLINQVPTFRVENMPYGGIKDSGLGREGVRYAMEEMTEVKSLIFHRA